MVLQEPKYRQFEGTCRKCGDNHTYYNSVKRHRDFDICDDCEKKDIVEMLTGQKTFSGAVMGEG